MQGQIESRRGVRLAVRPGFRQVGDDRIIGSAELVGPGDERRERFQVITVRDGKIVDMEGFDSLRAAERFARRSPVSR